MIIYIYIYIYIKFYFQILLLYSVFCIIILNILFVLSFSFFFFAKHIVVGLQFFVFCFVFCVLHIIYGPILYNSHMYSLVRTSFVWVFLTSKKVFETVMKNI